MNRTFNISFFLLIGIIFLSIPFGYSQEFTLKETPEEIALKKEKEEEEKYLEFQKHFFEALQQKSREDYTKAIESLDDCKVIYPDNAGLNFEYAKNYLKLKDYENAIFFSEKALEKKPNNIHILEHLKETYRLQRDYDNAIKIQKQLVLLKPAKENDLILLYIRNKQKSKAKESFLKMEKLSLCDHRQDYFGRILFPEKYRKPKKIAIKKSVVVENINTSVKEKLIKKKDFKSILTLLQEQEKSKKFNDLVLNSNEGLSLFPAQPILYLLNAKGQNALLNYKKALVSLESGLDFIIDDNKLLANFYDQMKIAYLGLNKPSKATNYQNKALELRKQ